MAAGIEGRVKLAVVIPAYQAERHIRAVLGRVFAVRGLPLVRVIVVNDGSRDATTAEVKAFVALAEQRVTLIERSQNGGYGAAMKAGLRAALADDVDAVACIHADGQYDPLVLPALLSKLEQRRLDLLQGSRIASGTALSGGMPLYKYVANAFLNRLENRAFRLNMTDYHSGCLVYGRRALKELPFWKLSDSFDFDLEVIACARARGLTVGEEPIPTHYGDEESHLQPVTYGLRVLRVLWRYHSGVYAP